MAGAAAAIDPMAGVEFVVRDELRFKKKLGVGENAFASVKIAVLLKDAASAASAATVGATVAGSGAVAGTFFASTGWLAMVGLGAAAVTPVGVVVGAAVLTGGAYFGVARLIDRYRGSRVEAIPRFLNSNIDVLAVAIVDALGAIVLRIAASDGAVCEAEREFLSDYFVEEWGIDDCYARGAIATLEAGLTHASLEECVRRLSDAALAHPDCPVGVLRERLFELIEGAVAADGKVCEGERVALSEVQRLVFGAGDAATWWRTLLSQPQA